jgi:hypothetical protein
MDNASCMLDADGDGCIVASAGGGKTTSNVTLHAAAEARGVRAIVVTFTNATVADYIERANRVSEGLASHDNVFTFHKLAHRVLKELGSDEDSKTCADTVVALALEELRKAGAPESFRGVHIVLVDESQDCSRENFDLVRTLADVLSAKLVLVGDANQNIYRFRNASAEFLVEHAKRAAFTHTLGFNYRSTPAIIDMSREFMRHPIEVAPGGKGEHGAIPTLTLLPPKDVVARVTEDATRLLAAGNTVMLLAKSKRPRCVEGAVVRVGLQSFVNYFERNGVAYKRLFREVSEEGSVVDGVSGLCGGSINVATIHGSKGLEADAVLLVDVVEEEESEDLLEVMYVAVTRAREHLAMYNSAHATTNAVLARCIEGGLCVLHGSASPNTVAVPCKRGRFVSVTSILRDRRLLSETNLLKLARLMDIRPKSYVRAREGGEMLETRGDVDLCTLFGHVAENYAQMAYAARFCAAGEVPETYIVNCLNDYVDNRIAVPSCHGSALARFFAVTGISRWDFVGVDAVDALRGRVAEGGVRYTRINDLLEFVSAEMARRGIRRAILVAHTATQVVDIGELADLRDAYRNARTLGERIAPLFRTCLFFFQLHNHAGYRWRRSYDGAVREFAETSAPLIEAMVATLPRGIAFEKDVLLRTLGVRGRVDCEGRGRIIEFKFANSLNLAHFMQPCIYHLLRNSRWPLRCETWNLATGEKVLVEWNDGRANRWTLLEMLASVLGKQACIDDIVATEHSGDAIMLSSESANAERALESEALVEEALAFTTASVSTIRWVRRSDP